MPDISLADQSANRIRKLIEQSRFKPGAHLNIDLLAKEFGVSQTPVREALKKLIHEDWHTSETVSAKNGAVDFRGFYGDYKLTVHAGDKTIPVDFRLSKRAKNDITINL